VRATSDLSKTQDGCSLSLKQGLAEKLTLAREALNTLSNHCLKLLREL